MVTTYTDTSESQKKYADIKDDLRKSGEELSQSMKGPKEDASKEAKKQTENASHYAADEMEDLSHAAQAAAQALNEDHHQKLSSYVNEIAGYVGSMATNLRHKSADDLMNDAKHLARENPTLFIAGGLALGLGISRLAKSASHSHESTASSAARPTSERTDSFNSDYSGPQEREYIAGGADSSETFSSIEDTPVGSTTRQPNQTQSPGTSFSNTNSRLDNV